MRLNKIQCLEKFVLITFPFALAVGCTSTAKHLHEDSVAELSTGRPLVRDMTSNNWTVKTTPVIAEIHSKQEQNNTELMRTQMLLTAQTNAVAIDNTAQDDLQTLSKAVSTQNEPNTLERPALGIIHFAVNDHRVAESHWPLLKQHAELLQRNPNLILYVDGFADNRGPARHNYQLSKRRAREVADLLIRFGAPQSRIKANGYGESFPLHQEASWDENRRVELEYVNLGVKTEYYAGLK